MELALPVLAIVAVVLLVALAVVRMPFGRWQFTHRGRRYEVTNYTLHERILVDGRPVGDSWMAGDRFTYATHAIALPEGEQLEITIRSNGVTYRCVATIGSDVVYDSDRVEIGKARARLPGSGDPTPAPEVEEPADPRWPAARVLLTELSAQPVVAEAAGALQTELRSALHRLEKARRSADAHTALGGTDADLAAVVAHHTAATDEMFGLLRQLHLAVATRDTAPAVPDVEEALRRLEAAREVEDVRLRAARAGRQHQ